MRAVIFEKAGLENLRLINDAGEPQITDNDVLIKVRLAGVNPIDQIVISGALPLSPMPHIPGAEMAGTIEKVGSHVRGLNKGDRVIVYNRLFDGTCDLCLIGCENICRNAGRIGANTNGGFAEYVAAPQQNVVKIPDDLNWDIAVSLPVTGLTPFHALMEASLRFNETLVVFGASGSTGMMATQIGKRMGAKVIAVSKEEWTKDFGADYVITDYENVPEEVKELTNDKMADVVLNSVGAKTWDSELQICRDKWKAGHFWGFNRPGSQFGHSITLLKTDKVDWFDRWCTSAVKRTH